MSSERMTVKVKRINGIEIIPPPICRHMRIYPEIITEKIEIEK